MRFLLAAVSAFFLIPAAFAQLDFPEPRGYVNDFADILSNETEAEINLLAETIKNESDAEIAVVTVLSLEGYEPNYYAVELGRSWGVGTAERDDGVIFLTAVEDRETYIATGYGVEGYITDAQAYWITDRVVVPYFREGDYDGGILAGVQEIKKALVDLEALPEASSGTSGSGFGDFLFFFIFSITFIFPWIAAVLGRSKRWWPGGFVGGGIGFLLAQLFSATLFIILPLALFGFLFDYLASKNYKKGKSSWWTGGGSSGWGGGSSGWGGGSSGGGSSFGGFSGGSFGGGGGGSSW